MSDNVTFGRHAVASFAALAMACVLVPRTVGAVDRWSAPHPGVRHLHRVAAGLDVHVVVVDLRDPNVSIVATRPGDRFIPTTEFARRYGAQIAINANFYNRGSCGLAAGGGDVLADAYEDGCTASVGFGRANEVAVFDSTNIPRGPLPAAWLSDVVTGKPFLMRNGQALTHWVRPQHLYRPNPRTALGVSADRQTLVLLAADGRRRGVPGITGFQMVRIFREFGVADAINLDGGGSTTLVVDGRVRNHPSDGVERSPVSHLGIRIRGRGAAVVARRLEPARSARTLAHTPTLAVGTRRPGCTHTARSN